MNQQVSKRTIVIVFLSAFGLTGFLVHQSRKVTVNVDQLKTGPDLAIVEKYKVKTKESKDPEKTVALADKPVEVFTITKEDELEYMRVLESEAAAQERLREIKRIDETKIGFPTKATIVTDLGKIQIKLNIHTRPYGVIQFANLADGVMKALDASYGHWREFRFYEGRKIFRVLPEVGFQSGCPYDNGTGDPGFRSELDPIETGPKAFKKGTIALLADQTGQVGSQFFIFTKDATEIDVSGIAIGKVVGGWKVINDIMKSPINHLDHPKKDILITKIEIEREQNEGLALQLQKFESPNSGDSIRAAASVEEPTSAQTSVSTRPQQPPSRPVLKPNPATR
jgi:cyclophilin family peptidyl-prolyl cis-trans isomerase